MNKKIDIQEILLELIKKINNLYINNKISFSEKEELMALHNSLIKKIEKIIKEN